MGIALLTQAEPQKYRQEYCHEKALTYLRYVSDFRFVPSE